jgi:hypothetical protein
VLDAPVSITQTTAAAAAANISPPPPYQLSCSSSLDGKAVAAVVAPEDVSHTAGSSFRRQHHLNIPPVLVAPTADSLLSRHANHAEALLSKLRISPLSLSGALQEPTTAAHRDFDPCRLTSPFASPPPPYSPEHPHIILDHEKLPSVMVDLPPPLPSDSPKPRGLRGKDGDIFHLAPSAALTLLARYVELLVSMNGDIPPTPPPSNPTTAPGSPGCGLCPGPCSERGACAERRQHCTGKYYFGPSAGVKEDVEGVQFKSPVTPPDSETEAEECEGTSIIHHGGVDDNMHYGTIARKFWSKTAPEVPIEEYLFRYVYITPLNSAHGSFIVFIVLLFFKKLFSICPHMHCRAPQKANLIIGNVRD